MIRTPLLLVLLPLTLAVGACGSPPPDGAIVFADHCASCHLDPLWPRAPHLDMMRGWDTEVIVTALSTGLMEPQGQALTPDERRAVAEFIQDGGPPGGTFPE